MSTHLMHFAKILQLNLNSNDQPKDPKSTLQATVPLGLTKEEKIL
jgi:hypothetical protein